MKRERDNQVGDLSGRIKALDIFSGSLVARTVPDEVPEPSAEVIPIHEAVPARIPLPRRSRVFLRHGEGHGAFADLTLTAPRPRVAVD
ncbi:hypothetical protein ASG76_10970 [Nocardioides sp. Soil774]|uniref:hypothetical protein n=1 Tax=Nocardioides sp. Soil774 TaxID=1736408 RepID=UPI0007001B4B|nr:hypothetical protein [Nocardioides sp. Soil774]KRE93933.1 hypothetical protein ASG76_10970 [Nocardioides sp. Soil774]